MTVLHLKIIRILPRLIVYRPSLTAMALIHLHYRNARNYDVATRFSHTIFWPSILQSEPKKKKKTRSIYYPHSPPFYLHFTTSTFRSRLRSQLSHCPPVSSHSSATEAMIQPTPVYVLPHEAPHCRRPALRFSLIIRPPLLYYFNFPIA